MWIATVVAIAVLSAGAQALSTDVRVALQTVLRRAHATEILRPDQCTVASDIETNNNPFLCISGKLIGLTLTTAFDPTSTLPVPILATEIGLLTDLTVLTVSGSSFNDGFHGTVPSELANLKQLKELYLGGNAWRGRFPSQLREMKLTACALSTPGSGTHFCCPLPALPEQCDQRRDVQYLQGKLDLDCNPLYPCDGRTNSYNTFFNVLGFPPAFKGSWKGVLKSSLYLFDGIPICNNAYQATVRFTISNQLEMSLDVVRYDSGIPSAIATSRTVRPDFEKMLTTSILHYRADQLLMGYLPVELAGETLQVRQSRMDCASIRLTPDNKMELRLILRPSSTEPTCAAFPLTGQPSTVASCIGGVLTRSAEETRIGMPAANEAIVIITLERDASVVPVSNDATPTTKTTNSGGTTPPLIPGSNSGSLNISTDPPATTPPWVWIVVAILIVCCCLIALGAIVGFVVLKSANAGGDERHGNPMYHSASSIAMTADSSSQMRTMDSLEPSSSYKGEVSRGPSVLSASNIPFQEGNVIIDPRDLERGKKIGEGAFGIVYIGRWRGEKVAIKEAIGAGKAEHSEYAMNFSNYSNAELTKFKEEATRMLRLSDHPNVVPFYGVCLVPNFSIVCQFCEAGSLDAVLYESKEPISASRGLDWLRGIAAGTAHLHKEGIVHRDLAARNILLTHNDTAMLTDFGLAREGDGTSENISGHTKSTVGPVRWMAPEQLSDLKYSKASDCWMFACVAYEIYARKLPWGDFEIPKTIYKIMSNEKLQLPSNAPRDLHQVTAQCWSSSPSKRPEMWQVTQALNQISADTVTTAGATTITTSSTTTVTTAAAASASPTTAGGGGGGGGMGGDHQCAICGNKYPTMQDLEVHRQRRHV